MSYQSFKKSWLDKAVVAENPSFLDSDQSVMYSLMMDKFPRLSAKNAFLIIAKHDNDILKAMKEVQKIALKDAEEYGASKKYHKRAQRMAAQRAKRAEGAKIEQPITPTMGEEKIDDGEDKEKENTEVKVEFFKDDY